MLRYRSKSSIFVRKTLQVLPCKIKKALAFLSLQKGPAFFDEDDVCAGLRNSVAARLNRHHYYRLKRSSTIWAVSTSDVPVSIAVFCIYL